MRSTLRSRSNGLRVDAPWTAKHHRQRSHGPSGSVTRTPKQHVTPTRYAVATMLCGVPGCTTRVHSLSREHRNSTVITIGHMDLIRNPRYPRPRADGSPSRPVFLVPMITRVDACLDHWTEWISVRKHDPTGFLPDGKTGRHERPTPTEETS